MTTARPKSLKASLSVLILALTIAPSSAQVSRPTKATSPHQAAKLELVVQTGHSELIQAAALSRNGKFLATASIDKTLKVWETSTGLELRTLYGHTYGANAVAFSPDGHVLASAGPDNLKLWDVETGHQIRTLEGVTSQPTIAFSPDGRWLVLGQTDGTLVIWDILHDYKPRTQPAHSGPITALTISADSQWLASGSADLSAKTWSLPTGKLNRTLSGHKDQLTGISFSPDGQAIATSSLDSTLRVWSSATGIQIHQLTSAWGDPDQTHLHVGSLFSVAFSPDGKSLLAGDYSGTYSIWDAKTFLLRAQFQSPSTMLSPIPFRSDGSAFVGLDKDCRSPELYETDSGRSLLSFSAHASRDAPNLKSLALLPNGQTLLLGFVNSFDLWDLSSRNDPQHFHGSTPAVSTNGTILAFSNRTRITFWDVQKEKQLGTITGLSNPVFHMDMSPDARWIAYGGFGTPAGLVDTYSGKEIRMLDKDHQSPVVKFSPDGRWLASCDNTDTVFVWSVPDGQELTLKDEKPECASRNAFAFSSDSRWLAFSSHPAAKLWQFSGSGEVRSFKTAQQSLDVFTSVTFSPDGKTLAATRFEDSFCLFDVATGRLIKTFSTSFANPLNVIFTPDGKRLLAGYDDARIRIWDIQSGQELATMAVVESTGGWAIVDSKGRFDASPKGLGLLHWVVGNETIELSQLKQRYYEPGLLAKIMGFDPAPLRDVTAFEQVALSPEVKTMGPVDELGRLKIQLTNRGGGIGRIQVLVNDNDLFADARPSNFDPAVPRATLTLDLSRALTAPGEDNPVRIVAWNQEDYLSSRPVQTSWILPGTPDKKKPEFYAIISGISDYDSPDLQLKFAARDADNMAHAIALAANREFGPEHVHLMVLSTTGNTPESQPSKANLSRAFEEARKSKVRDVLLVYLAGHGVSRNDTYAYPTKQARTLDMNDPAILAQSAVTIDELTDWIKQIPAHHKVLILDTCAAGAAAAKLTEKRGAPSEQIRSLDRLVGTTGFHVLMGSAANAVSYEASQYGEGLVTYSLLQGMKGAALRDEEFVDVNILFEYSAAQVPTLAKNIGGIQQPQILGLDEANFDLGQLLNEDKVQIPLAVVKPMILRPVFLNVDAGEDNLGLMPALRKRLRDESYTTTRGDSHDPAAIFVDQEEMPDAIRPNGTYAVTDHMVVVNLVFTRNHNSVKMRVQGSTDDKDELVSKIFDALLQASKTL
jgi:WD40 repeat protein